MMNAQTHPITISQGAALLWLRNAGGHAATDCLGYVAAGKSRCPILLAAFSDLAKCGLVTVTALNLGGRPVWLGSYPVFQVDVTDDGLRIEISAASERRLHSRQKVAFGHA